MPGNLAVGLACLLVIFSLVIRIYIILPSPSDSRATRHESSKCSLGIFLGSGGHTAEMKTLLSTIDFKRYSSRIYVYCHGDDLSLRAVSELESVNGTITSSAYTLLSLPRARRVGQPILSTLLSSLRTLLVALWSTFLIPLSRQPVEPWVDVLLINGPGTCVILVLVCWIRRILGLSYTRIIYVESFARVNSLSLSGKLLRPFVDTFMVQWPDAAGVGVAHVLSDDPNRNKREGRDQVQYRGWLV